MIYIADSSLFMVGKRIKGKILTVPSVLDEIRDERSKTILELMKVKIEPPLQTFIKEVKSIAHKTKDIEELSETDIHILAKALEYARKDDVVLITDDYAIQNTAIHLGIKVEPAGQKRIRDVIIWEKFCTGCKRRFPEGNDCPVCGTPLKKRRKIPNLSHLCLI